MNWQQFCTEDAWIAITEIIQDESYLKSQIENIDIYESQLAGLPIGKRRLEFLTARWAINKLLKKEIEIGYHADGKPYLLNDTHEISITHSQKWLAIITHPYRKVGIDIEIHGDKMMKVCKRFLSLEEQQSLNNDIHKIHLAWSAKETLYKVTGKQVVDFAKSIQIEPFEFSKQGTLVCTNKEVEKSYPMFYQANPEYYLVYTIL